jgi:two-component system, NarL family, nitrate/nitrite sensor histidine kinase NarX
MCTTASRRTWPSRCASWRCSTSRASTTRRRARVASASAGEAIAQAHRVVRSRLEDLRGSAPSADLRPALEATAERFERRGLPVRLSVEGPAGAVGPDTVAVVCRVAGEALANVARHARASAATLVARVDDRRLELLVDDDGVGFDPAAATGRRDGHFGLTIMRERAQGCGGECEVRARPGGGTRVLLRVPLRVDAAAAAGRPESY